jgi:hypothetical protein
VVGGGEVEHAVAPADRALDHLGVADVAVEETGTSDIPLGADEVQNDDFMTLGGQLLVEVPSDEPGTTGNANPHDTVSGTPHPGTRKKPFGQTEGHYSIGTHFTGVDGTRAERG